MIRELVTSLRLSVATIVVCCVIYTLAVLAFAAVAAPDKRMGSLVEGPDGTLVGSRLIAQGFARPEYFWPRPSAVNYDAAAAGGSNLSPTNSLLRERAEEIIHRLNLPSDSKFPSELLAASGSGLDPHISLAGALVQVPRVASARGLRENELNTFVEQQSRLNAPSAVGGELLVNVLLLNLAIGEAYPMP
jgi:K+-transporting ATPase ATPase C chain